LLSCGVRVFTQKLSGPMYLWSIHHLPSQEGEVPRIPAYWAVPVWAGLRPRLSVGLQSPGGISHEDSLIPDQDFEWVIPGNLS
jgi:hypothetical protein